MQSEITKNDKILLNSNESRKLVSSQNKRTTLDLSKITSNFKNKIKTFDAYTEETSTDLNLRSMYEKQNSQSTTDLDAFEFASSPGKKSNPGPGKTKKQVIFRSLSSFLKPSVEEIKKTNRERASINSHPRNRCCSLLYYLHKLKTLPILGFIFSLIYLSFYILIVQTSLILFYIWEKSVSMLPLLTTSLWTLYGCIMEDNFVITPYAFGLTCELIKLFYTLINSDFGYKLFVKILKILSFLTNLFHGNVIDTREKGNMKKNWMGKHLRRNRHLSERKKVRNRNDSYRRKNEMDTSEKDSDGLGERSISF